MIPLAGELLAVLERRGAARNAIRSGVPEQVVMDLGGWRTRSVLARYNVTSERDLADALERVSLYNAERAAETPKGGRSVGFGEPKRGAGEEPRPGLISGHSVNSAL